MDVALLHLGTKPKSVGILGFDGIKSSDLVGPLETFVAADAYAEDQSRRFYDANLIGVTGRSFVSETGLVMNARHSLSSPPNLATIIVPGRHEVRGGETCRSLAYWFK